MKSLNWLFCTPVESETTNTPYSDQIYAQNKTFQFLSWRKCKLGSWSLHHFQETKVLPSRAPISYVYFSNQDLYTSCKRRISSKYINFFLVHFTVRTVNFLLTQVKTVSMSLVRRVDLYHVGSVLCPVRSVAVRSS